MNTTPYQNINIYGLPYEYLKCKNINEMIEYLKQKSLFQNYPKEFVKELAKLEMEKIINLKLKNKELINLF